MHRVRSAARAVALAGLVTIAATGCGQGHTGDAASCVGPYLDDQRPDGTFGARPPTVQPGGMLVLHGHWYTDTCNDSGRDDPVVPLPDVTLTVVLPGGRTITRGPLAPGGPDLGFATEVSVPVDTPAGVARVTDDREHPATYAFTVG